MNRLIIACFTLAAILFAALASAGDGLPTLTLWIECIERGVYPGTAEAWVGYAYDGAFTVTAEDARLFGDTATGETIVSPLTVEPGVYPRFVQWNVGAFKAVTWKIILHNKLHLVTVWDNPDIPDCPYGEPTPMPTMTPATADI